MDKKIFLFFIIILSFFVRIFYFYAQPDLCTDHLSQMAMANNFLEGHGFSFKYLDNNLNVFYSTHIQWPPLYPLILAGITFTTGNTLFSSLLIQLAVLVGFIFIWSKIFKYFNELVSQEAFYFFVSFLIISTSILNNINTVLVFSLLLLSVSLYFTFAFLLSKSSNRFNIVFASVFSSSLFWTHYSYFFVAFFPAITLITIYYFRNERSYLIAGISSFLISLIITSGVLIYNYINTGFINYMDNPALWDAGFFPEHLLLTDPFFLNAFFKTSYFFDYLFKTNHQLLIDLFLQLISIAVFLIILCYILRLKKKNPPAFEGSLKIIITFSVIIVLTLSFLVYFTLHYHEIPRPGWTHIGDPRYLSAVYLSIIAIVIILLFLKVEQMNEKIKIAVKAMMLSLIFINLLINIYVTYKEWGNYSFEFNTYKVPGRDLEDLYKNIRSELYQGNQPVFIDNELTVRSFRISQYAGAPVISAKEVRTVNEFPSNIVFFFIIPEQEYLGSEDKSLLDWSTKFNVIKTGSVYNNVTLYKVMN